MTSPPGLATADNATEPYADRVAGSRAANNNVALRELELLALYAGLRARHRAAAVAVASKPRTRPVAARLADGGLGGRRHHQPLHKGAAAVKFLTAAGFSLILNLI